MPPLPDGQGWEALVEAPAPSRADVASAMVAEAEPAAEPPATTDAAPSASAEPTPAATNETPEGTAKPGRQRRLAIAGAALLAVALVVPGIMMIGKPGSSTSPETIDSADVAVVDTPTPKAPEIDQSPIVREPEPEPKTVDPKEERVEAIRRLMKSDELAKRMEAIDQAAELGRKAGELVPDLITALKDPKEPLLRASAAAALGRIGMPARPAMPALIAALNDPVAAVQTSAANALDGMGLPELAQVPDLAKALRSTNLAVRGLALSLLVKMELEPKQAAAVFAPALIDPIVANRQEVMQILAKLPADIKKPHLPAFLQALGSADGGISHAGQEVIQSLGPLGPEQVPALAVALRYPSVDGRIYVCRMLGKMGPAAGAAYVPLHRAALDANAKVKVEASKALAEIGYPPAATVPLLVVALADPEPRIRLCSVRAFAQLGPAAKAATPGLQKAMQDKDHLVQFEASYAFWRVTQDAKPVVKLMTDAVRSRVQTEHDRGLQIAGKLAPEVPEARALLIKLLDDKQDRDTAVKLLGQVGKPAVPDLLAVLNDDRLYVRLGAVRALGEIGPDAQEAVGRLQAIAKEDGSSTMRTAAMQALARIQK